MTISYIISRFKKNGFNVTRSLPSGNVIVTTPRGFNYPFPSYHAAYHAFWQKVCW